MQISYNILNLPQTVTQSGTTKATYGWFADGSKYSVLDAQGNGYCYIGSLIYSTTAGAAVLESTDFSGGRIVLSGNTQTIHYHHKDHLGSVRAVTDTNGTVIEQNAYYPFGGRHNFGQTYAQTSANRYKFNGKELQTTGNLGLLDYGARMYDTKIARWLAQDPLAEKYYPFSAYNYCVNNPVMFVDPDGRKIIIGNNWERLYPSWTSNDYIAKVSTIINELISYNNEVSSVINEINNSQLIINIVNAKYRPDGDIFNGFLGDYKGIVNGVNIRSGGTIYFDPDNFYRRDGEHRPPIIGLSHELGHALNQIMGIYFNLPDRDSSNYREILELNEDFSYYLENIIRELYHLELRKSQHDSNNENNED